MGLHNRLDFSFAFREHCLHIGPERLHALHGKGRAQPFLQPGFRQAVMKHSQLFDRQLRSALQDPKQCRIRHGGPSDHDTFDSRCGMAQRFQVFFRGDIPVIHQVKPADGCSRGEAGQIRSSLIKIVPASGMDDTFFDGVFLVDFHDRREFFRAVNAHAGLHADSVAGFFRVIHDPVQE